MNVAFVDKLKRKVSELKREIFALYLAVRDPRTPWYAKAVAAVTIAYALSPIDLIPDFIPILGYLDDFILLPLGIVLALKMIPSAVMVECRARAATGSHSLPRNWLAAVVIALLWLLAVVLIGRFLLRDYLGDENWDAKFGY
jgi:uncharacterized membrane protein YkvA (DUF1232 family)